MRRKSLSFVFIFFLISSGSFVFGIEKTVDLISKSAEAGISLYWDPLTSIGIFEKNNHQVSFKAGDDFVLQDYTNILREKAPVIVDNKLVSSEKLFNSVDNYLKSQCDSSQYRIGAILIDPGHGGKDPGAIAEHTINGKKVTVRETDINLNVGLKLYGMLKRAYPTKKILMTRDKDVYLTLEQRTKIANSVKLADNEAVLYISIHVNSSLDSKASGYEVWYLSPGYNRSVIDQSEFEDENLATIIDLITQEEYLNESILIAKFITDGISSQVGTLSQSRGIKPEEWFVVRNVNMPSVLVETGFLSNAKEAGLLVDEGYLQKMSNGIYNGLQAFITHFERTKGFTGIK